MSTPWHQVVEFPADQKVEVDETRCGPFDQILSYLMDQVYDGMCPLFFAQVPAHLVVPYADWTKGEGPLKYDRLFEQISGHIGELIAEGNGPSILVYPRKKLYVSSDDYQQLHAYRQLGKETIPCWILGSPGIPGTLDIQGPAPVELARRVMTGQTEDTLPSFVVRRT